MSDIVTIVWKELKELWQARSSPSARLLSYLPILLVFGVFLPLQQRESWLDTPLPGVFSIVLPFILAGGAVADSFAGERERHTLETLLASRLSDQDIFLGKVLATVIYSVGLVWACMVLSLITLNVTARSGRLVLYSAPVLWMIALGPVLMSLLTAAVGVFISLRAPTVRAAAQVFSIFTLVVFVGGPLLLQALPESAKEALAQTLFTTNWTIVGLVAALMILAIDVLLLALGVARFKRARLIID